MRVLEAWARGVVIVASPAAASGLTASDKVKNPNTDLAPPKGK